MRVFEILGQRVKPVFPESAVMGDPLGGLLQGLRVQVAAVDPALLFAGEQTGLFEHAEMFGDGGEGHVEGFRQFRDGRLPAGQPCEDRATRRIGQRRKRRIEQG